MTITTTPPSQAGVRAAATTRHQSPAGLQSADGVSPERQQAIAGVMRHLTPDQGRLSPGQLRSVATALAARRDLWSDLVVRDPDVRWYLALHRSRSVGVWLLAWERGQDTNWHDHGGSSGSLALCEGNLTEQYRTPSGRMSRRQLAQGQAIAFGPGHVHNVGHLGAGPATSIHAYSPPLVAMTYYAAVGDGLVARQTVAVDGPEGDRDRGSSGDAAISSAAAPAARPTRVSFPDRPAGIDALLAQARSGLHRLQPAGATAAVADGGVLVDIRPLEQRILQGEVPGAVIIGRNVLEWRLDPGSDARIPALARPDRKLILMCSEGYASSLAAASLRRLGLDATDLDGGFRAWQAAGLPSRAAQALG